MSTAECVERRLTAILAADVAAYSRLMGADEEGTLAQLKAHRKALVDLKITEHRGRVVKTTGDGMLIEAFMTKFLLTLSVLTVGATALHAASPPFYDGNKLLSMCLEHDVAQQARCTGYAEGISDAYEAERERRGLTRCGPDDVKSIQVRDVIVRFLQAHPEDRHYDASSEGMLAIQSAWCLPPKP